MARKKRTPENDDHKRGSDYAAEQISSAYFQDWVWDQMVEAERMRQSDPSSVLPIETKAHALKIARNMFQQLTWDTKREVSESKEFFEGFEEMLDSQKEWLAEMVLDFNREAREKTAPETREAKRTPTSTMYQEAQVFINGRFQVGFTFTPSRGPEAAAREVLSLTRDGDTIEVKQGQEVWTYKVTGKGIAKRLVTVRETREAYGRRGHRGGGNDRYKQYEEEWKKRSAEYRAKTDPLKAGLVEIDGQDLRSRGLQVPSRSNEVLIASLSDPRKGNEPVAHFYQYPGFGYGESFGFGSKYYVEPSIVPAGRETRESRRGRRPVAPYYSK